MSESVLILSVVVAGIFALISLGKGHGKTAKHAGWGCTGMLLSAVALILVYAYLMAMAGGV